MNYQCRTKSASIFISTLRLISCHTSRVFVTNAGRHINGEALVLDTKTITSACQHSETTVTLYTKGSTTVLHGFRMVFKYDSAVNEQVQLVAPSLS